MCGDPRNSGSVAREHSALIYFFLKKKNVSRTVNTLFWVCSGREASNFASQNNEMTVELNYRKAQEGGMSS